MEAPRVPVKITGVFKKNLYSYLSPLATNEKKKSKFQDFRVIFHPKKGPTIGQPWPIHHPSKGSKINTFRQRFVCLYLGVRPFYFNVSSSASVFIIKCVVLNINGKCNKLEKVMSDVLAINYIEGHNKLITYWIFSIDNITSRV